jgi:hypothetical protein
VRTLVDIPNDELESLNALSKAGGVSRAESIRRAIKAYVDANRPPAKHEGFGLWKDKGIDTDEYLRKIRSEWDREWDPIDEQQQTVVHEAVAREPGR